MWTQPDRTKKQKYGVICGSLPSDQFLGQKLKAIDQPSAKRLSSLLPVHLHKVLTQPGAYFTRSPCSHSDPSITPSRSYLLCNSNMTSSSDVFLVSSSTALGMAEDLVLVLNTIIRNLPEPELRRVHNALERSVRIADDILCNIAISATFDVLSLSDGA